MTTPFVVISHNADGLAESVLAWMRTHIAERVADGTPFRIVLAGGSTPRLLYRRLVRAHIDWSHVELYWGDERFVPGYDLASNAGAARADFVDHVAIPTANVHPIPVPPDAPTPADAAARYEQLLRAAAARTPGRPLFDVVLLGMGDDGHTASLFPGHPTLAETQHWVIASEGARPEPRVTLTYAGLAQSAAVAILVTGAAKRPVLQRALAGDAALPIAGVTTPGDLVWFVTEDAAP